MLTLLLVSLYEFKQFLQIVLWIAIPGTILAAVITTIMHYRRKKALKEIPEPEFADQARLLMSGAGEMGQLPDWLASANPENTTLLKRYEREIRKYKEDYSTLEQDFRALEEKYSDLLNKAYHNGQPGNEALDQLQQEIKGYKLKIAQLQQAIDFNSQPDGGAGHDVMELHELRISLSQAQDENSVLREKLEEHQYLVDLLEEKKKQIDFLQQQLEQRIKTYHQMEKQAGHATAELEQLRTVTEAYNGKEQALQAQLTQKEDALREKDEQIVNLETQLSELKEQQATLHTLVSDRQDVTRELESIIEREREKIKDLEGRLELSNQIFIRIYAELEKSMDTSAVNGQQPVHANAAIMGQTPAAN